MNILICSEFFYPSVGGAQKVAEELAINFIKKGNSVTVATSYIKDRKYKIYKKINIREFKISGNSVNGIIGDVQDYKSFILKGSFDLIIVYAAQQWTFDLICNFIDEIKTKVLSCPCGFSALNNPRYKKYFEELPNKLKKFKKNIFHGKTYQDFEFAKRKKIKNVEIIHNAASLEEFKYNSNNNFKKKYNLKGKVILNVANYSFMKGQDLSILVLLLLKTKNVSLVFIGNNLFLRKSIYFRFLKGISKIVNFFSINKKVIFLKKISRKDTLNAFFSSDVFLFTSRIECSPLVLFETSAAGLPFVSRKVGNSSEIANLTKCGYTKNSIFDISKKLDYIFDKKKHREKLSKNGRDNFLKKYNWEKISQKYLDV
jgi:L-malate glycosyltransferase